MHTDDQDAAAQARRDHPLAMAAQYGCDVDVEATMPLVERHRLQL